VVDQVKSRTGGLVSTRAAPQGGDMEARSAVLEEIAVSTKSTLRELRDDVRWVRDKQETDFRIMFGVLITAALGLATLMARGFHWF
jgi:cell division GTPase FtsZ